MRFAVPKLTRHQHGIEKRCHTKRVNDAESRWRMRQVGQKTEAVFALEGGKHLHGSRDGRSIIDKRAEIRLDCQGNAWIIGLDVVPKFLQGSANPEPIVRLLTVVLCSLHKSPGRGTVDGDKGIVGKSKTTAPQALQQSPHGF